jgi:predicted nucleic acid-binding protein
LGEAEAIALASFRKHLLLVDDKEGRAVAAMMEVSHIGTAGLLLEAYFKDFIDFSQLENDLRSLSEIIWLSSTVVLAILKKAREKKT